MTNGFKSRQKPRGWDALADWYEGWVGKDGSEYHKRVAIPSLLTLLDPKENEKIIDIGAGLGVLAPFIHKSGSRYTGIDVSEKLLSFAKTHHGKIGRFIECDAAQLHFSPHIEKASFDAATFLLSIQDMNPLEKILASTASVLKPTSRIVILMTHPAFRIPRQSGWGYDENRKLQYRRIDRYITPLNVPMKSYSSTETGKSISFHRPIEQYINTLADVGFFTDRILEIPIGANSLKKNRTSAEKLADEEIPLFLGLRARRINSIS